MNKLFRPLRKPSVMAEMGPKIGERNGHEAEEKIKGKERNGGDMEG